MDHIKDFEAFHAHVYFDEATSDMAKAICQAAGEAFTLTVGRHHEKPVGPHPRWSCQLAFSRAQLEPLVQWLETHRQGLTVFTHALSGQDLKDHTDHVLWLGEPVALKLEVFAGNDAG
jgi:DOPA 4,5-dioxygenase